MTHIKYLRLHQLTTTCGYDLDLWSSYLVLVDANENKIILEATDFQSIFKGRAEYCVELLFLAPVVPGVQGGTPIEHSMRQIEPADCDVPEKLHKSGCVKQRECVHHTFFRRMCAAIHILRWRRKKGALVKASASTVTDDLHRQRASYRSALDDIRAYPNDVWFIATYILTISKFMRLFFRLTLILNRSVPLERNKWELGHLHCAV